MPCTEAYREHIMYTFNGYCKTVIRFAAINAWRDRSRRRQKEISLEYLTEEKFYPLGTTDEYFEAPYEEHPITINDGVDSAQGENDFAPLRNIFNEWMVRDTSKKIRAVKRSKGMSGKPVTSKPVYGYLMDEDENFIIDEEAAPVVKQIYILCLAGNGPTKIARMLTEQKIPTPGKGRLPYRYGLSLSRNAPPPA